MNEYKVTFLPDGIVKMVPGGKTIMSAVAEAGIELEGPCGGKGTCGKCRVLICGVTDGLKRRWVLACQTAVTEDLIIEIPQAAVSMQRKSTLTDKNIKFQLNPGLEKIRIQVAEPTLENQAADLERTLAALDRKIGRFSYEALRALPSTVREKEGEVTVTLKDQEILKVEPGDRTNRLYGLAIDIGTTTVVVSLVNLLTGETLSTASATNTQNIFGADVIARIEHASKEIKGLEQLQKRVVNVINRLIEKLCEDCQVTGEEIVKAAVAGNTTMGHLFLGLDPGAIAPAPFIPVIKQTAAVEASKIGLKIYPAAEINLLPNIAGYVGGDTVAVILATKIYQEHGVTLAIDIGTNGEMVLGIDGQLIACSTAAGPAFEGAQIRHGMRAAAGAIEGVKIEKDVSLKIIGSVPAKGICGSGLIDAIAELLSAGIIDEAGKMMTREKAQELPEGLQNRLGKDAEGSYFVLAFGEGENPEVVLTQKDVRELQLAKGAVRAGIEIMLKQAGLEYGDIDRILLAGAFGNYIDKESAQKIGLLPPVSLQKVASVGNAAGLGAKIALLSSEELERAEKLSREVKHIELSMRSDFQDKFIDSLYFG